MISRRYGAWLGPKLVYAILEESLLPLLGITSVLFPVTKDEAIQCPRNYRTPLTYIPGARKFEPFTTVLISSFFPCIVLTHCVHVHVRYFLSVSSEVLSI